MCVCAGGVGWGGGRGGGVSAEREKRKGNCFVSDAPAASPDSYMREKAEREGVGVGGWHITHLQWHAWLNG